MMKFVAASTLTLAVFAAACTPMDGDVATTGQMESAQEMAITGKVAYRQRIALVPGSTLEVTLSDISLADAPSVELARDQRVLNGEQVPLAFSLAVKSQEIRPNMRYAVRATITDPAGNLIWTTDTIHLIDNAAPRQDMGTLQLVQVTQAPASEVAFQGTVWRVEDINRTGIIDSSHITFNFGADGRVSGSTGCNNFNGGYTQDGAGLKIGALATTRRGCVPALMNQEMAFLKIMQDVTGWSADEHGRVSLITADGRRLLAVAE